MKSIVEFFRKDKIGEPPWGGFSLVRRGAEQFSKHPSTIKQKRCRNDKKMTSALWSFFESGVQDFCARIIKDEIGEPPWDYNFLVNLDESEYPKYLAKIFNYQTGEKLPLRFDFYQKEWIIDKKRCKTFNQKIQWLKLYGVTDLMRKCTDKVAVRDYVREIIGEKYLKPVLQIIPDIQTSPHPNPLPRVEGICELGANPLLTGEGRKSTRGTSVRFSGEVSALAENDVSTYFDQINWEKLPQAFVIKCNHGCKWQYIIKNKDLFLQNKRLIEIVKKQITGWLEQDFCFWGGFELQYRASRRVKPQGSLSDTKRIIEGEINKPVYINKYELWKECQKQGIEPKILIESLMRDKINLICSQIQIFCFNGYPKILIKFFNENKISIWNEKFHSIDNIFYSNEENVKTPADNYIKQAFILSKELSKKFNFVRVDFILYKNKLYFEELTFTPYSGFNKFSNIKINKKLGKLINIEGTLK